MYKYSSRCRTSYSRRIIAYHVATVKPPPPKMATSSGLFLATIYNQSQLAERKHVAHYWSINTAATAVPLSAHPSPLTYYNEISGGHIGRGGCSDEMFCRPSTAPAGLPLWCRWQGPCLCRDSNALWWISLKAAVDGDWHCKTRLPSGEEALYYRCRFLCSRTGHLSTCNV